MNRETEADGYITRDADLKCENCSMRTEGGGCRVEEWIDNAPVEDER